MSRPFSPLAVAATGILTLAVLVVGCGRPRVAAAPAPIPSPDYEPGLQRLLEERLARLQELARDPAVQAAVAAANREHDRLTPATLAERDARWQAAAADDPLAQQLATNPAAQRLAAFGVANPGFVEVFVTDRQGLVVAMSNRTSDYLQADEAWWQQAYAQGQGRAAVGAIEYDASAHRQAIALCVPVAATPGGPVVGVIKALYDMDAVKAEL